LNQANTLFEMDMSHLVLPDQKNIAL
jgi:hypothetical protein